MGEVRFDMVKTAHFYASIARNHELALPKAPKGAILISRPPGRMSVEHKHRGETLQNPSASHPTWQ